MMILFECFIRQTQPNGCYLISAIFDPPFPMMQPISSLGTVISWVCCALAGGRFCGPAKAARAEK
jgi:hypothetical protein